MHYECWKCHEYYEPPQGKISTKTGVFTCYSCLKIWNQSQIPIWKQEVKRQRELQSKKPLGQMDIFEVQETLLSVF